MKTWWENGDWYAEWIFGDQAYYVYYKGKYFTKEYRFKYVKNYIK